MLEGSDAINISFTIIKLFSFKKFFMQTSITGALPLFNRFHQTLLTLFVIFSFDSLLDGMTETEK